MKKIVLILICCASVFISACGRMTEDEYSSFEAELFNDLKQISQKLYPVAKDIIKNDKKTVDIDIFHEIREFRDKIQEEQDNIPSERKEDYDIFLKLQNNLLLIETSIVTEKVRYIDVWEEYISITDEIFDKYDYKIEESSNSDISKSETELEKYMNERYEQYGFSK